MLVRPALVALSAVLALALAAPAAAKESRDLQVTYAERMALATAHAGEPVDRVRFLGAPMRYDVLGDHALLVQQTHAKGWLVEVQPDAGCRRLSNWRTIRLDVTNNGDTMNTRGGYVVGDDDLRCKIIGLREVDMAAMRADRKQKSAASEG